MTNKTFYAFCRDQRKVESDPHKKAALADVYGFMWECGVTRSGVTGYIERRVYELTVKQKPTEAYQWVLDVFTGKVTVGEQTKTLF